MRGYAQDQTQLEAGMMSWVMAPLAFGLGLAGMISAAAAQSTPPAQTEAALRSAGHRPLEGDELRKRLVGNTNYVIFLGRVPNNASGPITFPVYYRSDKERVVRRPDRSTSTTLWWIDADQVCGEEKQGMPGGAGHRCYRLYDTPSLTYSCRQPDGECFFAGRWVPGNPENL
jgi:hypothetical protein